MYYNFKNLIPAKLIHNGNFLLKNNFKTNYINNIYKRGEIPTNTNDMPLICYSLLRENQMITNRLKDIKDNQELVNFLDNRMKLNKKDIDSINDKFLNLLNSDIDLNNFSIEFLSNVLYLNYNYLDKNVFNNFIKHFMNNIEFASFSNLIDIGIVLKKMNNTKELNVVLEKIENKKKINYQNVNYNGNSTDQYSYLKNEETNCLEKMINNNSGKIHLCLFDFTEYFRKNFLSKIFTRMLSNSDYIEPISNTQELSRLKELGL